MQKHYNIYYLFLEDKEKKNLPEDRNTLIQKDIEDFYKKIKPP